MIRVKETDSFPVELTKNFAQAFIGTAVGLTGVFAVLAAIGIVIEKRKPVFLKPNQKVVTIDEPKE